MEDSERTGHRKPPMTFSLMPLFSLTRAFVKCDGQSIGILAKSLDLQEGDGKTKDGGDAECRKARAAMVDGSLRLSLGERSQETLKDSKTSKEWESQSLARQESLPERDRQVRKRSLVHRQPSVHGKERGPYV